MPTIKDIYQELQTQLAVSSGTQRQSWAQQIVAQNIDLKELCRLAFEEKKTATRFSWLLSDVGILNTSKLLEVLPYLFEQRDKTEIPNFEQQFVKYWRICGIPEEHKGTAIDLMFQWLADPNESTHIKTVALDVLQELIKEYPELKNELRLCLEELPEEIPVSFKKSIKKINI